MSEFVKGFNPRERRAMIGGLIARARANPQQPELIDQADAALQTVGPKSKPQIRHLEQTLNRAALEVWNANRSPQTSHETTGSTLKKMIAAGTTDIVIIVPNSKTIPPAVSYRQLHLSHFPQTGVDVGIVVDPNPDPDLRIPTGGLRGTRKVLDFTTHVLETPTGLALNSIGQALRPQRNENLANSRRRLWTHPS